VRAKAGLELRPYPEYRESGLPWLGAIPAGWEVRRNGRLFSERNQTGAPDLPILEVSLKTGVRVRDFASSARKQVMSDRSKYKRAAKGDIAYNMMRMWQGAVGVAPVAGLVSPAYVVARPYPEVDSRYYAYLFRTNAYMREVDTFSRGIVSDRNRLYWDAFKQMPSAFPPRAEQETIADFLDSHGRGVARVVQAKRRLAVLLSEQGQLLVRRALTGMRWPSSKLRSLVFIRGGMTPAKSEARYWTGDVPWVSPKDMKVDEIHHSQDHISWDALRETRVALVEPPSVLIVVRGMILARTWPLAISRVPLTVNQDMKALCPRGAVSAEFLFWFLKGAEAEVLSLVEEAGHGTRCLRTERWRDLLVPVPPKEEQERLVRDLEQTTATARRSVTNAESEIALLREYRTRLIADVVTGKLDVRGASLPAIEDVDDLVADEADETADDASEEEESDAPEEVAVAD